MSRPIKELLRRISDQIRDEKGQSLIIIAFLFVGLVALVGLAVDLGTMYVERTKLGQAIDAAALAGAQELPNEESAWNRALEFLKMNGYDPTNPSLQLSHTFPDEAVRGTDHYQMQIEATKSVSLNFMRVLGFNNVMVSARAVGENANRLDLVLVLDRTGSIDDDTCNITRSSPQYACNLWLTNATNFFQDDFNAGTTGWTLNSHAIWQTGGYVRLTGGSPQGQFTRQFNTLAAGHDAIKVTFRARMVGMSGNDLLKFIYSVGGGSISTALKMLPTSSWQQIHLDLPTGAARTPNLVVGFQLEATESGEYAEIDDVFIDLADDSLGPHDGRGGHDQCTTSSSDDCGCSRNQQWPNWVTACKGGTIDPFLDYFHEQPIYDTLVAADNFLDYMDPDMDLVGLATYATDATIDFELSSDLDAITDTLYTSIDPEGCTNLSQGIYAGITALGTNAPHHGRTNAVKVMILLTDGWSNTWPGSGGCACDTTPPISDCYEGTGQPWGRSKEAVQWAKENGIIIFVIAQGNYVNETFLRDYVAKETFGKYYQAVTTDQLAGIFQEIAQYLFLRLVR